MIDGKQTLSEHAFSTGFSHGNYAEAYQTQNLTDELLDQWVKEYVEDPHRWWCCGDGNPPDEREQRAYRLGCLLGFFASYENHEVTGNYTDEVISAYHEAKREGWGESIFDEDSAR